MARRKHPACELQESICNGEGCPVKALINVKWLEETLNGETIAEMLALKKRIQERNCPKLVLDYLDLLIEVKTHKKYRRKRKAKHDT